jgi:hypothetical protein
MLSRFPDGSHEMMLYSGLDIVDVRILGNVLTDSFFGRVMETLSTESGEVIIRLLLGHSQ